MMKNAFTGFLVLALSLLGLISACGGPQELSGKPGSSSNRYSSTACGIGSVGVDTDGDGLLDDCEDALGSPKDDPDCDDDGISDFEDNPNDCLSEQERQEKGDECDQACQEKKAALAAAMSNSLLLGSSMFSGQGYPGLNITIKKSVISFRNQNSSLEIDKAIQDVGSPRHVLTDVKCAGMDFYAYTYGDITIEPFTFTYEGQSYSDPGSTLPDVNFELCGTLDGYDPAQPPAANTETPHMLKVRLFGGTVNSALRVVDAQALLNGDQGQNLKFRLSDKESGTPSGCEVASAGELYNHLHLVLDTIQSSFQTVPNPKEDAPDNSISGSFQADKISSNWKRRTTGTGSICNRRQAGNYGAGGYWIQDGSFLGIF